MCAQLAALSPVDLQLRILAEIPEAIMATDNDRHIVYCNAAAERLHGFKADDVLGKPLEECCPEFCARVACQPIFSDSVDEQGRWSGEIILHREDTSELCLACWVSLIKDDLGQAVGVVWLQRDISEQKKLERELQRYRALLDLRGTGAQKLSDAGETEVASIGSTLQKNSSPAAVKDVILWAEDDDNDAVLMSRAWQKAEAAERLIRVRDGAEVIQYFSGEGIYRDRERYPLPRLLLLDIKMPHKSGMDVILWLQEQPDLRDLPVVILTSSGATEDIHEAARLHVKGYLLKPFTVDEWVLKVKTVTQQCR